MNRKTVLHPSWIIIAAGVSVALHVGKLPPSLSVLQQELGLSLVQAGFLLSTMQVAGMLLGLAVGLSADRLGLKRSMLTGLALIASASMLGALVQHFAWLLALRVLEGLGFLIAVMPGPGLIRRQVQPSELSRRMGWWSTYMPLGSALALLLSPWVLQAMSWRWLWLLLGLLVLGTALLVWRHIPADRLYPAPAQGDHQWRPRLALTLRSRGPWLVGFSFMVYAGQWISVIGFLPTIYTQAGLSSTLAGMLTALVAAINMTGNIAAGKLLHAGWTARRSIQTGFVLMGLCTLLAFAQWQGQALLPLWLRFIAILVFSAAGGLVPGSLFTCAVVLAPSQETVSTTVGFMQQWSSVGQFVGPPLVAAVATWAGGWHWTWAVCAGLCGCGWLLALLIGQQWSRVQPH